MGLPLNVEGTLVPWLAFCMGAWLIPLLATPLLSMGWLLEDWLSPARIFELYYGYPVWLLCVFALLVLVVVVLPRVRPEQAPALHARRSSGKYTDPFSRYVYRRNRRLLYLYELALAEAGEGGDTFAPHLASWCGAWSGREQTIPTHYRTGHFRQTATEHNGSIV